MSSDLVNNMGILVSIEFRPPVPNQPVHKRGDDFRYHNDLIYNEGQYEPNGGAPPSGVSSHIVDHFPQQHEQSDWNNSVY